MAENEIGRVIGVHGFHIRVELDSSHKSPVRAGLDGVETQIKINAFVTFEIGAGEAVLGIVTDLDAREVFEPDNQQLTLELVRPRRVASVQLLGTVSNTRGTNTFRFDPGVNVLPTLDTPAIPARREILAAVLTDAPKRSRPPEDEHTGDDYDGKLLIGVATAAADRQVYGSFNDLFSRPLAVVGNTGSGKSCSIAHLLQEAGRLKGPEQQPSDRPHFFIIDINGEYAKAFGVPEPEGGRLPNRLYANGHEISVPIWLMNAHEVCVWLNAAEQTQQPALVNLWAICKGGKQAGKSEYAFVSHARGHLLSMLMIMDQPSAKKKGSDCAMCWKAVKSYFDDIADYEPSKAAAETIETILGNAPTPESSAAWNFYSQSFGSEDSKLRGAIEELAKFLDSILVDAPITIEQTADKPVYFETSRLDDPTSLEAAASVGPGDKSLVNFLQGLQLRIQNRRADKRWHCFYNYGEREGDITVKTAVDWFQLIGVGTKTGSPFTVIDLSMISHEVLPYVCGIIGRMLLELREHVMADARFKEPWVVVLEEAHNYVRPARMDEARGLKVSRETFERIAKEGRKFGLSLVVASQRPSEISQTVLSQCANFLAHRLQNPDDIDHFKQIVPSQTRRLFDQITILRSGEAIVLGSAFFVPSRVQVQLPEPSPSSRSSTPYRSWGALGEVFDVQAALANWITDGRESPPSNEGEAPKGN